VYIIMRLAHADNKCAMCGKAVIIRDDHEKRRHQQNSTGPTIIVEQIDGSSYTFDTADCVH
jgi:predicted RNA-binding Zn-ribbon protein involved in translation (DUF1610 family)